MTMYADPVKESRLEEAITLGFIIRSIDSDGVMRYALTDLGKQRWILEKMGLMR